MTHGFIDRQSHLYAKHRSNTMETSTVHREKQSEEEMERCLSTERLHRAPVPPGPTEEYLSIHVGRHPRLDWVCGSQVCPAHHTVWSCLEEAIQSPLSGRISFYESVDTETKKRWEAVMGIRLFPIAFAWLRDNPRLFSRVSLSSPPLLLLLLAPGRLVLRLFPLPLPALQIILLSLGCGSSLDRSRLVLRSHAPLSPPPPPPVLLVRLSAAASIRPSIGSSTNPRSSLQAQRQSETLFSTRRVLHF